MKKGFIVYYDILEQLEDMTDEQVGKIFRAMLRYEKFAELPIFEGELKVAFKFIKTTLDIEQQKYKDKCAKNKESIEKRWSKGDTDEYECIEAYTNNTDIDTHIDTDTETNTDKKNIKKKKVFIPPTFQEVKEYAVERNRLDLAQKYFDYFSAGNWIDSKGNKVKNWKQKFITWEQNNSIDKPNGTQDKRRAKIE